MCRLSVQRWIRSTWHKGRLQVHRRTFRIADWQEREVKSSECPCIGGRKQQKEIRPMRGGRVRINRTLKVEKKIPVSSWLTDTLNHLSMCLLLQAASLLMLSLHPHLLSLHCA
jgi:hypothetical protein